MRRMIRYEMKKVFAKKGNRIALVLLFGAMLLMLYFLIGDTYWVNEKGELEYGFGSIAMAREAKREWAGWLTEKQLARMIEENSRIKASPEWQSEDVREQDIAYSRMQGFNDVRYLIASSFGGFQDWDYTLMDRLTPEDAAQFYPNRIRNLQEWLADEQGGANGFTDREKQFLLNQYENLDTPFYYGYHDGWDNLFQWAPGMAMLTAIALGFLCAGIFADEFRLKAGAVFFSSCHGRKKAIAAKTAAGFLTATIVYWTSMLSYTALVLVIFGAEGGNCLIQSDMGGWKSFYNITFAQEYLLFLLCGWLGCLFMSALVMLASAAARSSLLAVTIPLALIFLPTFLGGLDTPLLRRILGLLPDQLLQISNIIHYFNLYELGGRVLGEIPMLMILYLPLTLLLIPVIYRSYKRHQVTV